MTERDTVHLLSFELAGAQYALRLNAVREVARAVAVAPLPGAPALVEGVIDVRGEVVPVLDIRKRFSLAPKPLELSDAFVLALTRAGLVGLRVDRAGWPAAVRRDEIENVPELAPADLVAGVCRLPEGLVVIHDLDAFLTADESVQLRAAVSQWRIDTAADEQ